MNSMTNRLQDLNSVQVGDKLPELVKRPTALHLFRFSAVTWNAHRIHYEPEYARSEGHPDILVQAHLHGSYLSQLVIDWAPARARMTQMGWKNRRRAIPGDTLTSVGTVLSKHEESGRVVVRLEMKEMNQHGELCAEGQATVEMANTKAGE